MNDRECVGRLLDSATHDLRNALAVMRETSGLAQDLLACAGDLPRERMEAALREVAGSVTRVAALADSLDCLAQGALQQRTGGRTGTADTPCDVGLAVQTFSHMMARRGKACGISFAEAALPSSPVLVQMDALEVQQRLLETFLACEACGGKVMFALRADTREGANGVLWEVYTQSGEESPVVEALTACPQLMRVPPRWTDHFSLGKTAKYRFWLPLLTTATTASPEHSATHEE